MPTLWAFPQGATGVLLATEAQVEKESGACPGSRRLPQEGASRHEPGALKTGPGPRRPHLRPALVAGIVCSRPWRCRSAPRQAELVIKVKQV